MLCLRLVFAALLLVPLAFPSRSLAATRSGFDTAILKRDLAGVVAEEMARRHLVGAVVVVVDREGVILAEGYGFADLDQQTPVRPEYTTFRAASVSKLLTTTAVMQLVERGSIDLDREIADYVEGVEFPRRDGRPITPRHLLTHSAGVSEGFIGSQARTREDWLSLREYLGRGLPGQFAPAGEIISYANYDIGLAGLLVESVSGLSVPRDGVARDPSAARHEPQQLRDGAGSARRARAGVRLRLGLAAPDPGRLPQQPGVWRPGHERPRHGALPARLPERRRGRRHADPPPRDDPARC